MEHVLPMVALALLASQIGKQAARMTIFLFPMTLCIGILAGNRVPLVDIFHFANLAVLAILGGLIVFAPRMTSIVPAIAAIAIGVILGWRSGGDWAVSGVGLQFVPGAALCGFSHHGRHCRMGPAVGRPPLERFAFTDGKPACDRRHRTFGQAVDGQ
jgi:hypothetical protein